MIIVSACLAGDNCTHEGTNKLIPKIRELVDKREAIKICPEVLGGRTIPRESAEILNGEGKDVLEGRSRVLSKSGRDLTHLFIKGAILSYEIASKSSVKSAILKANSPSCGCGKIYDGTFSGRLRSGDGVTTVLFKQKGITVITEKEFV